MAVSGLPTQRPNAISAAANVQVDELLGELFDGVALHDKTLQAGAREAPQPMVRQLRALYKQCRPALADYRALTPGPEINRLLGRLVALLQGQQPAQDSAPSTASESAALITSLAAQRIRSSSDLRVQAADIRRIAGLAEAEMEYHYSERLAAQVLRNSHIPTLENDGSNALARLRTALAGFPYLDSYEQLVRAELRLLSLPVRARFLRASAQSCAASADINHGLRRLQAQLDQLAQQRGWRLQQHLGPGQRVALCGCGPLPITGLMLHILSGAKIILVDCDPRALEQARHLVQALQERAVISPTGVQLRHADAAELRFVHASEINPSRPLQRCELACDALMVASLIPEAAKQELFTRLREHCPSQPLPVIVRSARGLTAELAYEATNTAGLSDLSVPYCGELWPENQLDASCPEAPLLYAPATVINTSELYYRLPLPVRGRVLSLDSISSAIEIESAIHLLYQATAAGSDSKRAHQAGANHVDNTPRFAFSDRPAIGETTTGTIMSTQCRSATRSWVFFIDPIEGSSYPVTETGYALLYRAFQRLQAEDIELFVVYPDAELHEGVDEHGMPALRVTAHRLLRFFAEPYTHYRSQRQTYTENADLGAARCHEEGPPLLLCLQDAEAVVFRQETGSETQRKRLLQALSHIERDTVVYLSPRLGLDPRLGSKVLPRELCPKHCPRSFHTDAQSDLATIEEKAAAALRFVREQLHAPQTVLVKPINGNNGVGIRVLGTDPLGGQHGTPITSASLQALLAQFGDLVVQEYLPSVRLPADLKDTPPEAIPVDRRDFGEVRFLLIDGTLPRAPGGRELVFARRTPADHSLVADSGISRPTTLSAAERAFLKQLGRHYVRLGIYFGGGDLIRTADAARPFLFTDAARAVCGHAVVTGALNGDPYLIVDQVLDSLERRIAVQRKPDPTFVPYRGENGTMVPFYERVEGNGTAGASSNS